MNALSRCIIEVAEEPVAVLVLHRDSFIFHASHPDLVALNGREFDSPHSAERQARAMLERNG